MAKNSPSRTRMPIPRGSQHNVLLILSAKIARKNFLEFFIDRSARFCRHEAKKTPF